VARHDRAEPGPPGHDSRDRPVHHGRPHRRCDGQDPQRPGDGRH
jgi:hypothetical protein